MAAGGGPLRPENAEEGISDGHDPKRDLPPLLAIPPLPRPLLHDPLRLVVAGGAPPLPQVVDPGGPVGLHVAGGGDPGPAEAVEVLEGGGAAAEGEGGGACPHALRAGAEDEGGELRPEQGAPQGEEAQELKRGDQVGPPHLVLPLQSHPLPCFLRRLCPAFLQIPPLLLILTKGELNFFL